MLQIEKWHKAREKRLATAPPFKPKPAQLRLLTPPTTLAKCPAPASKKPSTAAVAVAKSPVSGKRKASPAKVLRQPTKKVDYLNALREERAEWVKSMPQLPPLSVAKPKKVTQLK